MMRMVLRPTLWAVACACVGSGCVSNKVHQAEVQKRAACEAREGVLLQELLERRRESEVWAKRLAELGREVGQLEREREQLRQELSERTAALGESASQLLADKRALEEALAGSKAREAQLAARLAAIREAQAARLAALERLRQEVAERYAGVKGVSVEAAEMAVLLTLPDGQLFDKSGVLISAEGRQLLKPLAELLAQRPEVGAEVLAYTDNALPKTLKQAEDTWGWSLMRATQVVRVLIQQFNVNANQLTPIGKGEYYPVASNETPEGRQRNRRTVVALYPPLVKVPPAGQVE